MPASDEATPDGRRFHVQSYGCQMSTRDAELLAAQLVQAGLTPAAAAAQADVVVINTCSVRDKAEHKLYSELGLLRPWKDADPLRRVVVSGCVAQQERERIVARAPFVDVVLGTHQVRDLGRHLAARDAAGTAQVATEWKHDESQARLGHADLVPARSPSVFVTIQEGCDNVCAFCVVPFTRGREASRPPAAILDEVSMHAARGAREIVLLGQNVNAYGYKHPEFGSFAALLRRVHEVPGIARIRFTSPHPQDFTDDLIAAYRDLPKLCPSAHLPLQAGSDRVLAAMRRGYTAARFRHIVADLRAARPGMQFSTDVIVGFPGETAEDFAQTLALLDEVRFSQVYAFVYSPRPYTVARNLDDPVPLATKKAWLAELLDRQRALQTIDYAAFVGRDIEVLWTECVAGTLAGRSAEGRVVHGPGTPNDVGEIRVERVVHASGNALYVGAKPAWT